MSRGRLLAPNDYFRFKTPSPLELNSYPSDTRKFSNFAALFWNVEGCWLSRLVACFSKISVIDIGPVFCVPLVSGLLLSVNSDPTTPTYSGRFFDELARELIFVSLLLCWSEISGSVLRSTFTDLATASLLAVPIFWAVVGFWPWLLNENFFCNSKFSMYLLAYCSAALVWLSLWCDEADVSPPFVYLLLLLLFVRSFSKLL